MSAETLYVGKRQMALIERAHRSRHLLVMPGGYLERRACRRLEARGILSRAVSFPDVWKISAIAKIVDIQVTR